MLLDASMHHAPSMIDPTLQPPCRLVSEKYRVRGWNAATTYHKVPRFAPGRGAGWPTSTSIPQVKTVLSEHEGMEQKTHRNPACIMLGCTGEGH